MTPPPIASDPSTAAPQARWFTEEVQPHEPSLRSYLRGSFPAVRDIDDVVQESYLRVWKAGAVQPIHSARAFLFAVARRLALDLVRRNRVSPIESVGHLGTLDVLEDWQNVVEDVGRRERVELLAEAIAELPTRCREVFILYKIKGRSRRETADELGLADKTV